MGRGRGRTGRTAEAGGDPAPAGTRERGHGARGARRRAGRVLGRIGFEQLKSGFRVPTWRARDVTREVDLIEEVARFKLPEIPFTLPRRDAMFGRLTREQRLRRQVEDVLVGIGYAEAYTPSFVADGDLRLPEPLSAEAAALRAVLYASLLEPARRNADAGEEAVALFEGARVYRDVPRSSGRASPASPAALPAEAELPEEHWHVAGIADGGFAEAKWAVEQIYSALGIEPSFERTGEPYLHPGKAARTTEGWLGELHPALLEGVWGVFELDPRRARGCSAPGRRLRGGQPLSGGAPGSRLRRRRGGPRRRDPRRDPRGGRRAAAGARGLRRVPQPRHARRGKAVARVPARLRLRRADADGRGRRARPRVDR